jgi:hypothetical protein
MLGYEGRTTQKRFGTVVSIDAIDVKEAGITGKVIDAKAGGGGQYTLLIILIIILIVLNAGIFIYFGKIKSWLKRPPAGPTGGQMPQARSAQSRAMQQSPSESKNQAQNISQTQSINQSSSQASSQAPSQGQDSMASRQGGAP